MGRNGLEVEGGHDRRNGLAAGMAEQGRLDATFLALAGPTGG